MTANIDLTISLPRDIRQTVFSSLSREDLFAVYQVCRLFRADMTNDFFKKRCFAFFPGLKTFPNFYEPFVKTVEMPWKWMCLSLSCKKINVEKFTPVSSEITRSSQEGFKSYLLKSVEFYQSELEKDQASLKEICGKDDEDPDSKINQAKKFFKENWTERDQIELNKLHAALHSTQSPVSESDLLFFMRTLNLFNKDAPLKELAALFIKTIKDHFQNPQIIQLAEKIGQSEITKRPLIRLESKKKQLEHAIKQTPKTINQIEGITKDSEVLREFSHDVLSKVILLLPLLRDWLDHIPTVYDLLDEIRLAITTHGQISDRIASIQEKINLLPNGASESIWQQLHDQCANGEQEWMFSNQEDCKALRGTAWA